MKAKSLYLHVPFCERKCPYCAFSSAQVREGDEEKYLAAVAREAAARAASADVLDTLYIGGGTPTALSAPAWGRLIEILENSFSLSGDAEVTVEANPNSLSASHLGLWREWRVTRVSIGVQSTDDAELAFLGRLHTARQAADAVAAALAAGFAVSLDLIFGLPGAHLRNWARTLRDAARLSPDHISIYQLTVEPGTPFDERGFSLPEGYAEYRYAQWYLAKKGYEQYEIASFARPGQKSRHNAVYWADDAYLGIGPGAWGCLDGVRYRNAPSLDEYARLVGEQGRAVIFEERLEGEAAARQAAVLALRTSAGIDMEKFTPRYGAEHAEKIFRDLKRFPSDLVLRDDVAQKIRLTAKGMRVANAIWSEIV